MLRRRAPALLAATALVLAGCAAAPADVASPPTAGAPVTSIRLVRHGGHTGIVVRSADVPAGLWPERRDFPGAEYLEVGWGDHDFYRTPEPGPWTVLKAAFLPSASVLHVVGFRGDPAAYFRGAEIVELAVPGAGIDGLARYIHDAHLRPPAGSAPPLGAGNYGDSRFYAGSESFHLFRTCNVWTAGALRAAGLPVSDSVLAGGLMAQARALAAATR